MSELVLISHGQFCEELKKSAEMIMGPQDDIHTVALLPSEGPEDFRAKFEKVTADLDDFMVFADLMGGTPCNVAARILMEGKGSYELYAGMNLPMLISYINGAMLGTEPDLMGETKAGVVHVNDVLPKK
ncbi:PTS sugar transporter subunit IIA [Lacticaseibacillus pabuli]|uniref:PTS sugar transporter subunit IIA n=1 Tax=Lacticaseibacillus pabuli TaxID=3025672 RepID=A0ABY7WQT6_9LACO|nr:PTS sugar transporter subunit IIA [Lacticaseibacillus sp. KACC 23028]WDF82544.1 PTS sugar transporter subunit IIA [Lacticaseibacillus sp. KACC 23028]